uniref:Glyco_trans_2-like domain-containing protein n=1 Tax=Gongylonema pulchrum TaxID=637853 RepID=A0A183ECJ3_9BILA
LDREDTEIFVTTGDCDTVFGERYFDALEEDYWKIEEEQRFRTVWQSPLFYCINIHKSPFFVRVTAVVRAFFMMGYLIPWNINTMSVFSLTLKLFEDGGYTHPGYQQRFRAVWQSPLFLCINIHKSSFFVRLTALV